MLAVSVRLIPIRIGDVELLVEAVAGPVAGSQPTSVVGDVAGKVVDAYARAERAIVAVARSVAGTVMALRAEDVCPQRLEVEVGLKFTVQGDLVLASASAQSSLRVRVSYEPSARVS